MACALRGVLLSFEILDFTIKTVGAETMSKIRLSVVADINLHLAPKAFVIPDFFTGSAYWNNPSKSFNFR